MPFSRGGGKFSRPYHDRIVAVLDARAAQGIPTVLVSLHSFTPVYAGVKRPWHIGTLYQRDTRLPPQFLELLRAQGDLVVGDNEPYAVSDATDYTIPVHAERRGLINSGIEIRQDLIADETGQGAMGRAARAHFARDREPACSPPTFRIADRLKDLRTTARRCRSRSRP